MSVFVSSFFLESSLHMIPEIVQTFCKLVFKPWDEWNWEKSTVTRAWNRWAKLLLSPAVLSWLWRCLTTVYFSKQGFKSIVGESRLSLVPGPLGWAFASVASERLGLSCWRQWRTCSRGDNMTQKISGPHLWFVTTLETLLGWLITWTLMSLTVVRPPKEFCQ